MRNTDRVVGVTDSYTHFHFTPVSVLRSNSSPVKGLIKMHKRDERWPIITKKQEAILTATMTSYHFWKPTDMCPKIIFQRDQDLQ